ncbi:twin-arginine translocase TatA/TatE family subunit [Arthrobacter sp. VKM Ac-2550]|uniref:twin-arginine translocase TatA/TatE family subunit n=1 Tax=Crystallibacter permensis TaxID=1938888 RepID=UPI0022265D27|nr:twin-arginine translocase TatA/TatE family subunit [Arthrobacter sp. VKM Ac-2550]MCW2132824.1 sec-independent protein translocase protein TatB [Arthrobacter sp. VKM Ac-2550]
MLGINGSELVILAVIAVIVLGPERLPEYAAQLGRLVKQLRRMAAGAKDQLREEVGDDIVDMDWRKLDPRQYDPRRIIKEALLDDDEDDDFGQQRSTTKSAPALAAGAAGMAGAATATKAAGTSAAAARPGAGPGTKRIERLEPGQAAPFDVEAT